MIARLITALIVAGLAAAAFAGVATAAEKAARQTAKLKFTTKQPGTPSGYRLRIDYVNPDDPAAKPPAVRRVVETFAPRSRLDTSAPELCTASDPELMLLGPAACSEASKVATGTIKLDTGLSRPGRFVVSPVDFLNNAGELIFANHLAATETPRVVTRAAVSRRRMVAEAPLLPGTPPDGAAIDLVRTEQPRLVTERGSYLTTPPRCPRRGFWRNRIEFTYHDGVTQTVSSRSPCKRGKRRR